MKFFFCLPSCPHPHCTFPCSLPPFLGFITPYYSSGSGIIVFKYSLWFPCSFTCDSSYKYFRRNKFVQSNLSGFSYSEFTIANKKKVLTEVLEIIFPGSNFSRPLTLPLVFTIIHNMHKKFIQGCENGSTLFALKLILSFLVEDMLVYRFLISSGLS